MGLPTRMLETLDVQLRDHEERLKQLNSSMVTLEEEAAVHKMPISLGRDKSVLDAFGMLYDHPELAAEIARDPAAFARQRGITIPKEIMVTVIPTVRGSTTVEAHFSLGIHRFKVSWNRVSGFSLSAVQTQKLQTMSEPEKEIPCRT